ncbi:transposase [Xenorhabdus bovienii]|uniref:transposase n=1 Tax=Xenorhabdus bovienii TaxID=40576 RepID=UPI003BA941D2|nr:transposase [Xenorhabdus bovienii]MDE9557646.1 transposase [Xenorhabdus bovienii]
MPFIGSVKKQGKSFASPKLKSRTPWKLHLAIDAKTGEIIAEILTAQNTNDTRQREALLEQIAVPIASFTVLVPVVIVLPRSRKTDDTLHGPLMRQNRCSRPLKITFALLLD